VLSPNFALTGFWEVHLKKWPLGIYDLPRRGTTIRPILKPGAYSTSPPESGPAFLLPAPLDRGRTLNFAFTFSEVRVGAQLSPPASHEVPSYVSFPFLAALLQGTGCHEGSNPSPSTILCTLLPSVSIM
jgi:hypothetical protein